ncbi:hypothetical protein MRX96_020852 [Rhipicephalus microplus]
MPMRSCETDLLLRVRSGDVEGNGNGGVRAFAPRKKQGGVYRTKVGARCRARRSPLAAMSPGRAAGGPRCPTSRPGAAHGAARPPAAGIRRPRSPYTPPPQLPQEEEEGEAVVTRLKVVAFTPDMVLSVAQGLLKDVRDPRRKEECRHDFSDDRQKRLYH